MVTQCVWVHVIADLGTEDAGANDAHRQRLLRPDCLLPGCALQPRECVE